MVQKDLLGTISPTNDKKVTEISARVGVSLNALGLFGLFTCLSVTEKGNMQWFG